MLELGDLIPFTKDVLIFLGLAPRNIMLACGAYRFVAVMESANLEKIKVITPISGFLTDVLEKFNSIVSVHLAFADIKKPTLNIPGNCVEVLPYKTDEKCYVNTIILHQPPPTEYQTMIELVWKTTQNVKKFLDTSPNFLTVIPQEGNFHGLDFDQVICELGEKKFRCYLHTLSSYAASFSIHLNSAESTIENQGVLILRFKNIRYSIEIPGFLQTATWQDQSVRILGIVFTFKHNKVPISYYRFIDKTIEILKTQLSGSA